MALSIYAKVRRAEELIVCLDKKLIIGGGKA
jgi:hypothetical protein